MRGALLHDPSARRWALLVVLWRLASAREPAPGLVPRLRAGNLRRLGVLIVEPGSWRRLWQFVREPAGRRRSFRLLVGVIVVGLYARNFYKGTPSPRTYWEAATYCPYPDGWFVADAREPVGATT